MRRLEGGAEVGMGATVARVAITLEASMTSRNQARVSPLAVFACGDSIVATVVLR